MNARAIARSIMARPLDFIEACELLSDIEINAKVAEVKQALDLGAWLAASGFESSELGEGRLVYLDARGHRVELIDGQGGLGARVYKGEEMFWNPCAPIMWLEVLFPL
jgi:hypothetical protein